MVTDQGVLNLYLNIGEIYEQGLVYPVKIGLAIGLLTTLIGCATYGGGGYYSMDITMMAMGISLVVVMIMVAMCINLVNVDLQAAGRRTLLVETR